MAAINAFGMATAKPVQNMLMPGTVFDEHLTPTIDPSTSKALPRKDFK
jgi:hypothetical protein